MQEDCWIFWVCLLKKEKINNKKSRGFLWQHYQQKQKCANLKSLQLGTGTDVACVEDLEATIEISDCAEFASVNLHTTAKYRVFQSQVGNK